MNISREIAYSLEEYQKLTLKWNKTINLVSINSVVDFWQRHIIDSLQLLRFIRNKDIHLIDVGSGAGLPGMVLSIAGIKSVTLIESDSRKAAFLLQASRLSKNKITIINEPVQNVKIKCDVLTARAFANVETIFECTKNITVKDKYLLLKGEGYKKEVDEAQKKWLFNYSEHVSITSPNSKILAIKSNDNENNFSS